MAHDAGTAFFHQRLLIVTTHAAYVREAAPDRNVAIHEVVGRCLVGDDIRNDAARQNLLIDLGGIAKETDRDRVPLRQRRADHGRARRRDQRRVCSR